MNLRERAAYIVQEAKKVSADGGSVELFRSTVEGHIREALEEERRRNLAVCKSYLKMDNECLQKAAKTILKKIENLKFI